MPRNRWQRGRLTGIEGVDFVACRICGDRRRVISGRHLSKHGTDRLTYIEEYGLSPDQLIAKPSVFFKVAIRVLEPTAKPNGLPRSKRFTNGRLWRDYSASRKITSIYIFKQSGFSAVLMKGFGLSA